MPARRRAPARGNHWAFVVVSFRRKLAADADRRCGRRRLRRPKTRAL